MAPQSSHPINSSDVADRFVCSGEQGNLQWLFNYLQTQRFVRPSHRHALFHTVVGSGYLSKQYERHRNLPRIVKLDLSIDGGEVFDVINESCLAVGKEKRHHNYS